jgi:hypothetical protein
MRETLQKLKHLGDIVKKNKKKMIVIRVKWYPASIPTSIFLSFLFYFIFGPKKRGQIKGNGWNPQL